MHVRADSLDRRDPVSWTAARLCWRRLTGLLLRDGLLDRDARPARRRAAAALRAEGEAGRFRSRCRRAEPPRFVRLQAGAGEAPRQAAADRRASPTSSSARSACCARTTGTFKQRGKSGLWVSDLFPHLAEVADELTVIRSMVADTREPHAGHVPGEHRLPAQRLPGARVAGSRYGLGSETDDLPAFVVLPDAAACRPAARSTGPTASCRRSIRASSSAAAAAPMRRPVPGQADRRRQRRADAATFLDAAERRAPGRSAAATRPRGAASAATSWPRRCSSRCPRSPTCRARPATTQALYGLDRPETADFGRALPAGPAAARTRRAVRAALLAAARSRHAAHQLGRPRERAGEPRRRRRCASTSRSRRCCAT